MTPEEYLKKILKQQMFEDDAPELKDLRKRRAEIKLALESHFSESSPSIRWAGSMAKDTMIKESYDGDVTCYFPHDEDGAGTTLEEIYDNVAELLGKDYVIERKASALRVKNLSTKATKGFAEDLHFDVVPGRFTDDDEEDVFMHRTTLWRSTQLFPSWRSHQDQGHRLPTPAHGREQEDRWMRASGQGSTTMRAEVSPALRAKLRPHRRVAGCGVAARRKSASG